MSALPDDLPQDELPELRYVNPEDIRIPSYQPPSRADHPLDDHYDHRAANTLLLSRRDNTLWALDGQRRRKLALRDGIPLVAACILDGMTLQEEAGHFLKVNGKRLAVNPIGRHDCEVIAGNNRAITLAGVLREFRLVFANQGRDGCWPFRAVVQAERVFDDGGPDLVRRSLQVIDTAYPGELRRCSGTLLRGVGYFLARDAWGADDAKVAKKLGEQSVDKLHERAANARALAGGKGHGGGSPIYIARGIAALVYPGKGSTWEPKKREDGHAAD